MVEPIGLIGLGNMGLPFAERLMQAGYRVHVVDTRPEALEVARAMGAVAVESPLKLAETVATILLSLPTPDIVESVVFGEQGLVGGSRVRRVVDLSTSGPEASRRLAEGLEKAGIAFVDAPVSGGVAGARAGTVAVMVACRAAELEAISPALAHLGRIFHVGVEPGLGQLTKLLNNLLSAGALSLTAEAVALGERAGLNAAAMIEVFNAGSGRNSATLDKYPRAILPGTYDLGFSIKLMSKDVELCLRQAEALGLSLPTATAVREQWRRALVEIGSEADFSMIGKLWETDRSDGLAKIAEPSTGPPQQ